MSDVRNRGACPVVFHAFFSALLLARAFMQLDRDIVDVDCVGRSCISRGACLVMHYLAV